MNLMTNDSFVQSTKEKGSQLQTLIQTTEKKKCLKCTNKLNIGTFRLQMHDSCEHKFLPAYHTLV